MNNTAATVANDSSNFVLNVVGWLHNALHKRMTLDIYLRNKTLLPLFTAVSVFLYVARNICFDNVFL